MKQNELDNDLEFTPTIGLGGKLSNHRKTNKRQSWKWRGVCNAYRNPILDSDVGQMSSKNRGKTYKA